MENKKLPPQTSDEPNTIVINMCCQRCGEFNLDDAAFCRKCGLDLEAIRPPKTS